MGPDDRPRSNFDVVKSSIFIIKLILSCTLLLSSKQGTEVPGRLLHPSLGCRQSTASEICQSSLPNCSVDEVHSAVGPSLLGVRRLGTHYRTVSVIHRSAAAALGVV